MVLFVVVVAVLFVLLNWYIDPIKPGDKKDLVLALAQILGGTALLSGLYFTWRTLQVNREGQITDRFTRAIDQLGKADEGNKLFEIRLGGIYALERIARESEEDHWPIMEVLTAYVRQHAPRRPEKQQEGEEDATVEKKSEENSREATETTEVSAPAPDIQAIMTVLRRRTRYYGHGEPERLDLQDTNLSGANLSGAQLRGADLQEAHLQEADLQRADLFRANFRGAHLQEAHLQEANLQGAYFQIANLQGINLQGAKLEGANLRADLQRAELEGANLQGARLIGANLYKANLSDANLREANFSEANLRGADLRGAGLAGANLQGASLDGADLRGANLQEARGLTQEQIEWTIGLGETGLPEGLDRPKLWSKSIEEQWKIVQERLR